MTARDTSAQAYRSLDLTESEQKVMRWLHSRPDQAFNRRQISVLSGIPINCVAGRIFSLLEKGYIEELPAERDKETGKSAYPVRVRAQQLELI